MRLLKICSSAFCNKLKETRKMIVPQSFTSSPLQQYFHVVSQNYDFLLNDNPGCSEIYVHSSDSPSSLLRKNAIHIFPDSVPTQNVQEKYKAFIRKLQKDYEKSFSSCKAPAEVFHLQRRIKTQVRQRCRLIGKISGKYRHYNLFKSINQLNSERTMEQYKKNGIQVTLLGKNKIYPQGPVWLPTNDTYLKLLEKYLAENTSPRSNILDLGCGSGVLSFILGKQYKSAKIWAVDSNNHAVQTCKVNAATLGIKNIEAFQCDIIKIDDFQHKCRLNKCPPHFDLLISNPPWLIGKRGQHQSQILDGVYDNKGNFLNSTFKIANKFLSKEKDPRFILIYSDLSKNLGLQKKSIQQHCKQNNFLIKSVLQAQYPKAISKQSALAPYKLKSKVMLYQISRS